MRLLPAIAEVVTDLVFDSDGNATGKGLDDHELDMTGGYHFGFYSRPGDGSRGVALKLGGEGNSSVLIAFRNKQYELTLEKDEIAMANAAGGVIKIDENGKITATPASGQTVELGGTSPDAVVTKKDLQSLYFAINAAACTPNDGGAAFKTALLVGLGTAGWTTGTTDGQLGSTVVKAKRT
jgi:hypothetical protein